MPENPTDGELRQAESTRSVTTYSTRTKSKGSLGAGGQRVLDRDQDQWITGSRRNGSTRTKTKGSRGDRGMQNSTRTKTRRSRGDRPKVQAQPGPSPVDHWEHTGRKERQAETGEGRWESKNCLCSTCEQGCCGQCAAYHVGSTYRSSAVAMCVYPRTFVD